MKNLNQYVDGILNKDKSILSKAITLVESDHAEHRDLAKKLLEKLLPYLGKSKRIGISGTPGVGKSTFINYFGLELLKEKKSIAVLAVDPTSIISGGSILGDKTRMTELSQHEDVFIRPSPSKGNLGGVSSRTREVILLCEAFGFDHVLIESVGVGQSEVELHEMVDMFIMLLQPGAGDDLQGIKRGILEVVDLVVVHKSDSSEELTNAAHHHYQEALHVLHHSKTWIPKVLKMSSVKPTGWKEFHQLRSDFFLQNNLILERRSYQLAAWLKELVTDEYLQKIKNSWKTPMGSQLLLEVNRGEITVFQALEKFKLKN